MPLTEHRLEKIVMKRDIDTVMTRWNIAKKQMQSIRPYSKQPNWSDATDKIKVCMAPGLRLGTYPGRHTQGIPEESWQQILLPFTS